MRVSALLDREGEFGMTPLVNLNRATLDALPLPALDGAGDKEVRGRVVVVAGSDEIPGAAILAAVSALRAGAGKLVIATHPSVAVQIGVAVPEARAIALHRSDTGGLAPAAASALRQAVQKADAVLIGPGLTDGDDVARLAHTVLGWCADAARRPHVVLDAAAMAAALDRDASLPVLLTPHAGEMAHLSGVDKQTVLDESERVARDAAQRWAAVVALKGAVTHIGAPDGRCWRHEAHNPGLAMSGSGDTLAGMMIGLAARGATLEQAAAWAVVLHAQAGASLLARHGGIGFLARELPDQIPRLLGARDNDPPGGSPHG